MRLRSLAPLAIAAGLTGCDFLEWQALRVYLAVNPHLALEDGPRATVSETESLKLVPVVNDLEFPWDLAFLGDSLEEYEGG